MKRTLALFLIGFAALTADAQRQANATDPVVIVRNGLYGYINHAGAIVIQPQFLWATDFEHGYGTVYVCGQYTSIDKAGEILPLHTLRANTDLSPKEIGGKFGFIDRVGSLKIKPEFDDVLPFSEGLAAVKLGNGWGFIDTAGRFVIPPQFDAAFYFREGVGMALRGDTTVLIDKSGNELASGYQVLGGIISEGRIPVSRGPKYGYLDLSGAIAIPLRFDGAGTFSEGLAPVARGSKWGYIDRFGALRIPFRFDSAGEFGEGLAPVKLGEQTGFIRHSGSFAFPLAFDSAPGFWGADGSSDISRFWTKSGDFGYVDTSGNVIWGPVPESPEQAPLLGWSAEDKLKSCDIVSESIRRAAKAIPPSNTEN